MTDQPEDQTEDGVEDRGGWSEDTVPFRLPGPGYALGDESGDESGDDLGGDWDEGLHQEGADGLDPVEEAEETFEPPVHWPSLEVDDLDTRMFALAGWVAELQARFPEMTRVPECWPHHNGLVELLQALWDHERASFDPSSPPTAAVDWHRAFEQIENRLRTWKKDLPCNAASRAGAEHDATGSVGRDLTTEQQAAARAAVRRIIAAREAATEPELWAPA